MTPFYADEWLTVYGGDCLDVMRTMPSDSVDCVVTSPPYWGLRDYGNDGQLGLERTPEEYVANMVNVFREVRRVLKPSGTCWLNLGDSYVGTGSKGGFTDPKYRDGRNGQKVALNNKVVGLKSKDLVGIPWRVAFALQADGWYLRSDIIWAKPNPMPESVMDRPTKAHEYLFLLTKSARYYFDADAVREADSGLPSGNGFVGRQGGSSDKYPDSLTGGGGSREKFKPGSGRNIRSVWTIATRPYPGAHFAVFPPELPERCIKAGSSERGVCPECGAPWERVRMFTGEVALSPDMYGRPRQPVTSGTRYADKDQREGKSQANGGPIGFGTKVYETTHWRPTCAHTFYDSVDDLRKAFYPEPAVILDPFAGSGTVGMVANRLSRRAVLIDLNPEYLKQQMKRNAQTPLGLDVA